MNRITAWTLWAVMATSGRISAQVELRAAGADHINISVNGQAFSDFYIGDAYPKPFLAPLRSANGLIVTRRYPMENVEGESRDHPHHRGLWIGYGNVNGINFWENEFKVPNTDTETPRQQGRIVLRGAARLSSGKESGSIAATFEWRDGGGTELMREERRMIFYADGDVRRLDVDAAFTAATSVEFADTKEGFFAIRLADSMAGKNGGAMTNSQGAQGEKGVWGKRADWVDYDGTAEGQKVGIVVFDNPANYNHPPRWHSRDYGLFAINPFGVKEFEPKAGASGGHTLAAGESMRFRYRVVVHSGDVPKKKIAEWYAQYCAGR